MPAWKPKLPPGAAPLYVRLAAALEADIRSGVLPAGRRLPAQRDLADALDLSVGTVTKAYVDAERRGLVNGHVGRGTFVAGDTQPLEGHGTDPSRPIDLAVNVIPIAAARRHLADALQRLRKRPDAVDLLGYAPAAGIDAHRRAAAIWLGAAANFTEIDWTRIVMTTGAQQAMSLALSILRSPGTVVLCEAATFYGIKTLSEHTGTVLQGLAMDGEGLAPDALDRAGKAAPGSVLYVMPTVQNPTGRTMGMTRRRDIVAIARKHNLWILEDDNYAIFAPEAARADNVPIAQLAPERTFYAAGVSKCLAPGLRCGFLVTPPGDALDRVLRAMRATVYTASSLGAQIMAQWVEDGVAHDIAAATASELRERVELLRACIRTPLCADLPTAPHVWLELSELDAERVAGRALRAGVVVTAPGAPVVDGSLISGLRICLGSPPTRVALSRGIERLRTALDDTEERSSGDTV